MPKDIQNENLKKKKTEENILRESFDTFETHHNLFGNEIGNYLKIK